MKVAVLAVQGAFEEQKQMLQKLGVETVELRQKEDVQQEYDGLILPGGESTVQRKLLQELDMYKELKKRITDGLPVLATCAGLILLAEEVEEEETDGLKTLPVVVKRNAYGRQLGSFHTNEEFGDLGTVPMTFIRAPYIDSVKDGVQVLAEVDDKIVAVQYKNQVALAFHPELDESTKIHEMFLDLIRG